MRENYCVRSFALIVLGAIEILSIGACTSRGIYEANQQDAHNACLNKPSGIERDECLGQTSQPPVIDELGRVVWENEPPRR